jgi:ATP-binding cassette, subfamily C, bacterial LapB
MLEAERLAAADPLIEAFSILTGRLHQPVGVTQLKAGLPQGSAKVSPAALMESAANAGFEIKVLRISIDKIGTLTLPCVLLLKQERACVLEKRTGQDSYLVTFPEIAAEPKTLTAKELGRVYSGFAIFARPAALKKRVSQQEEFKYSRFGWFLSAIGQHRKIYRDVLIAAIVVNMFAVVSPLFVMNVYDRVVPNRAIETLWVLASGALLAYLFDLFLRGLRTYFVDTAGREADKLMSGRIFRHLVAMRLDSGRVSAGALADELKQYESLRDFFTSATLTALVDFPFLLVFMLLIFLIGGWLVLVPLVTVPLALAVCWSIQKPLNELVKEGMRERAYKNSLLVETIAGLETVKTQNAEAELQSQWSQLVEVGGRNWVKTRALSNFALNVAAWIAQISTIIMVVLGVYLISDNLMTTGALVACTLLLGRVMAPLSTMANLLTRVNQSWESLQQLDRFMQREPERVPGKTYLERPKINGDFKFENVSFRYPEQEGWALQNINLHIRPGERVGIIGGMGSGKSTFIRLLSGLYAPTEGSLMVDSADIRQIDPSELRSKIGFIEQQPFLFAGTIRDNIALGHREVDDSMVIRAARIAGVTEFTSNTDAGLAQPVGERGVLLSGGQRQAVALARAFLFDPPILLMDEPTGAMDRAFESRFIDRLTTLVQGKTVVIITHRQAMLALCDRLIIMDQGQILADGPKNEVLEALRSGQVRRVRPGRPLGSLT